MEKKEIIEEAQALLSELQQIIDNHFYSHYTPKSLKEKLNHINDIYSALETI